MAHFAEIPNKWRGNFAEVSEVWPRILRKTYTSFCATAQVFSQSHEKISVRERNFLSNEENIARLRQTMNPLELKPEDLPMTVRLKTQDGSKEYVLVMTKQEKLLLNKPWENTRAR